MSNVKEADYSSWGIKMIGLKENILCTLAKNSIIEITLLQIINIPAWIVLFWFSNQQVMVTVDARQNGVKWFLKEFYTVAVWTQKNSFHYWSTPRGPRVVKKITFFFTNESVPIGAKGLPIGAKGFPDRG